jgi:hypothetical protein
MREEEYRGMGIRVRCSTLYILGKLAGLCGACGQKTVVPCLSSGPCTARVRTTLGRAMLGPGQKTMLRTGPPGCGLHAHLYSSPTTKSASFYSLVLIFS